MKKRIITFAIILLAAVGIAKAEPRMDIDVNFGFFYQNLAPYGSWMQIDNGIYGWRPSHVSFGWRPYSIGRWTWTESGWYWDSYEPFGWATYHYGRWINDEYYGWIWVPDYEWAPSWVEWRYDDDYIGWAPLPPYAGFRFGFGISFSFGWHSHSNWWNFVSYNRFCHNHVYNYFIDSYHVDRFFERTKYRTNYYDRDHRIINGGVDRDFVERRSGERIRETSIRTTSDLRDASRNGMGRESYVRAFRPGEDDIKRTRDVDVKNIARPERNISIDRERIAIRADRDNNARVPTTSDNRSERTVMRNERTNDANANREREIIRSERQSSDNADRIKRDNEAAIERNRMQNEAKAIERARQSNETIYRSNRAAEKRNEAVREKPAVRENSRQGNASRGFEMNQNRSEQKVEKQAERRAAVENRDSGRREERSSSNDRGGNNSRERKR